MERLQKVLAHSGVASRRKSEQLILDGRVAVNGKRVTELGVKVSKKDLIEVDKRLKEFDKSIGVFSDCGRGSYKP